MSASTNSTRTTSRSAASARDVGVVHPFLVDVDCAGNPEPTAHLRAVARALEPDLLVGWVDDSAAAGAPDLFAAHYSLLDQDVVLRARAPDELPGAPGDDPPPRIPRPPEQVAAEVRARLAERAARVPLLGLVLAGGRSERMGRPKWAIEYHGAPQVRVLHELLSRFCEGTYVSIREEQLAEPVLAGLPHVVDAFRGFGPLGGILTAMNGRRDAAWLVLACDLPGVTAATVERLLAARAPFRFATAYRSSSDGLPEPLVAVYEPKARLRLFQTAGMGYDCPRKMLINSRCEVVDGADAVELANVNSPDDYALAVARLKPGGAA